MEKSYNPSDGFIVIGDQKIKFEEMKVDEIAKDLVVFKMDGTDHTLNESTGCCSIFGKACNCGGFMHYQPVYGGYYYKCEKCFKEDV